MTHEFNERGMEGGRGGEHEDRAARHDVARQEGERDARVTGLPREIGREPTGAAAEIERRTQLYAEIDALRGTIGPVKSSLVGEIREDRDA